MRGNGEFMRETVRETEKGIGDIQKRESVTFRIIK